MSDLLALVEPLIPRLRRYARALTRDRASADDLVQDCLERVVGRWGQRRSDGDVRAWAFTILHNLAMNRSRDEGRRGATVPLDDAPETAFAQPAAQGQALDRADLLRALDALPAEQRDVLLLIGVEDLTYAEAARVLDVPVGTVMSRLSRGRERLARALERDGRTAARPPNLRTVR